MKTLYTGKNLVVLDAREAIREVELATWKKYGIAPKSYPKRPKPITDLIIHQTAGGVTPSLQGPKNTAAFFVTPESKGGRGWPGFAYHFYMPYEPEEDENGCYIGYQTQSETLRSWHTGAPNDFGIALAFQGLFRSTSAPNSGGDPSPAQKATVREWWSFLSNKYSICKENLKGHSSWGKPGCPGWWLDNWISETRGEGSIPEPKTKGDVGSPGHFVTWRDVQAALKTTEHDPGPLDGIWGYNSRRALESFQRDNGLSATGVLDEVTESKLFEVVNVPSSEEAPRPRRRVRVSREKG
jgi:peptidoglycan hydrolase-like protein with peptidoglycan-binding domain